MSLWCGSQHTRFHDPINSLTSYPALHQPVEFWASLPAHVCRTGRGRRQKVPHNAQFLDAKSPKVGVVRWFSESWLKKKKKKWPWWSMVPYAGDKWLLGNSLCGSLSLFDWWLTWKHGTMSKVWRTDSNAGSPWKHPCWPYADPDATLGRQPSISPHQISQMHTIRLRESGSLSPPTEHRRSV